MTKLTIVTDRRGKLIGAVQGHELSEKAGEVEANVSFAAGHKLHKVDVDIDLDDENTDPKEFERTLARHIPKSAAKPKVKSPRKKSTPEAGARIAAHGDIAPLIFRFCERSGRERTCGLSGP